MTRRQLRLKFDQWFDDDCKPRLPKNNGYLKILSWIAFEAGWRIAKMKE